MNITRRHFGVGLAAFGLMACNGNAPAAQVSSALPADLLPTPNADYDAWITAFQQRARNAGISENVISAGFQGTGYLPGVVSRDRNQIERRRTLEEYLSIAASDDRVTQGRTVFAQRKPMFDALEARYGVPGNILAAVWGLESRFGTRRGNVPVVSATSTLAYDGRRRDLFEKQLIAALRIIQNGDIDAPNLLGSWAGAMGHTQFIPTSYAAFAVDFNGDGRRDVWSDDPTDALASTAAYLQRNGWARGVRWGGEEGQNALAGRIIQPQAGGPKFSTTQNFRVIKTYNNSTPYALGVGHLADRIAGGGPIVGSFPPDRYGFSKADRQQLQRRLTAAGFDTQGTDGVIGPNTQSAISAYQQSRGLEVTGTPSRALLDGLR